MSPVETNPNDRGSQRRTADHFDLAALDPSNTTIHFIGVGGVSMRALALWSRREGFTVSGCDLGVTNATPALALAGVEVFDQHHHDHVKDADVVVHSMAIPYDHPELSAARNSGKAVIKRIEFLGELFKLRRAIGVTGTHGKSSTTGMLATMLLAIDEGTSVQLGASLAALGGNFSHGSGDWLVAEVDESDPGFAALECEIGIVTNLEDDHIAGDYDERRNYHASLGDLEQAARRFALAAPYLLYCADWPGLEQLFCDHQQAFTYGLSETADFRLHDLELTATGSSFTLERPGAAALAVVLGVPGMHNALNASAAIAAIELAGLDAAPALAALKTFTGVGRRWQVYGEVDGALVIDDYAHHATEVRAMLEIARATGRRVRAVLQPHRWIRTARQWRPLADAAALADEVVVLEIYGAGEKPIEGVSPDLIVDRLHELGIAAVRHDVASASAYLGRSLRQNDLIITLGAGDVWRVAASLAQTSRAGITPLARADTAASGDEGKSKKSTEDDEQHAPGGARQTHVG